jgi:V/A-type H+-transporting ATPase subunit I
MIVKMKRYTFLVYHKQYTDFLEKIRDLGVLHIIDRPEGNSENELLREKMLVASRIKNTLRLFEKLIPKGVAPHEAKDSFDAVELINKAEAALAEKDAKQQKLSALEKESERMEAWGSFSPERIEDLKNAGFELNFFACNIRKFNQEWEVLYNAFEIETTTTTRYFVTVTRPGQLIDIDADPVKLSEYTSAEIDAQIAELKTEIELYNQELIDFAVSEFNTLKSARSEVAEKIDFTKAILNSQAEVQNKVMLLQGWCPEESEAVLNEYLDSSEVYYETEEPVEEDKVPIKLKNNKFAKLFEMIGELYDLPNYHELDLTPFFAPFYMLFFGLCLGDVGYGLIFVIAAIFLRPRVAEALKPVFTLLIWLGGSTVVMGAVSANVFGYNLLESDISWIQSWKKYMLDANQLFNASLIIGVVQIMFGMVVKAINITRRFGFAASLSTWGWLVLILGCGASYGLSATGAVSPEVAKYMYYGFGGIGGLTIFLLNDIKRNPLINVGAGLWDAYNMVLGLMGDLLSYVRLFALGISGSVMGFVFNDLAINLSGNIPVVSQLVMVLIMLVGHGLNIFMSSLSSFVHPMRLTFVEFYKNAGFEGGGKKYRPFARYKEEKSLF